MAKFSGPFKFIGTLDDINAYKIPDSDEVIVRRKPGPKADQVKTDPSFERTRENYTDFGGASVFSREIRYSAHVMENACYSHIHSQLTGLGKKVSKVDGPNHVRGKRSMLISKVHHWLTDYDLNKKSLYHSVVRTRLPWSIDRESCTALIHIPELLPGIHLQAPAQYPFYRMHFALAVVTDIIWDKDGYRPAIEENHFLHQYVSTEWYACSKKRIADDISLTLVPEAPLADCQSLILYAGLEWGMPDDINEINPVRRKGCAKIMGLA